MEDLDKNSVVIKDGEDWERQVYSQLKEKFESST